MTKLYFRVVTLFALLCPFVSYGHQIKSIKVLAESELAPSITNIATIYSQKNNAIVSVDFGLPGTLINSIELGSGANVFISSHDKWLEALKQKGMIDIYSIVPIAHDRLTLVTSKNNPRIPQELQNASLSIEKSLKILEHDKISVIIDNNENSLGKYSLDLFKNISFTNYVERVIEDRTPILSSLKENPNEFIICFASQASADPNLLVLATTADYIVYRALVVAGDNMSAAREFLRFLRTSEARSILDKNGFSME